MSPVFVTPILTTTKCIYWCYITPWTGLRKYDSSTKSDEHVPPLTSYLSAGCLCLYCSGPNDDEKKSTAVATVFWQGWLSTYFTWRFALASSHGLWAKCSLFLIHHCAPNPQHVNPFPLYFRIAHFRFPRWFPQVMKVNTTRYHRETCCQDRWLLLNP